MKQCTKCKTSKSLLEFVNDRSTKDGLAYWCKKCRNESKKANYQRRREDGTWIFTSTLVRAKCLEMLGSKCVRCGLSDRRYLQVDHINGGGAAELLRDSNPVAVYQKIAKGQTAGYQLLCANCNWIKRIVNQEVPLANPESVRTQTKWRRGIRAKAIEILGGKCKHCGFSDVRALQIDHVNGDGAEERRTKDRDAVTLRISKGETNGYQLLCANCNWIKRYEMEEHCARLVAA